MTEFTVGEFIIFMAALVVAFLALRSYIPAWALYVSNILFALYWLTRILDHGPTVMEVVLLTAGVATAAHIWWRDLRGAARHDRPSGPGSP